MHARTFAPLPELSLLRHLLFEISSLLIDHIFVEKLRSGLRNWNHLMRAHMVGYVWRSVLRFCQEVTVD